jgi:hypothetical protein
MREKWLSFTVAGFRVLQNRPGRLPANKNAPNRLMANHQFLGIRSPMKQACLINMENSVRSIKQITVN